MNGKILSDGVLLKPEPEKEERVTTGGIYIPNTKKTTQKRGTVVLCGKGTTEKPIDITVGDVVYYNALSAREVEIDGEKYHLLNYNDCLYAE